MRNTLLKFGRPSPDLICGIHHPLCLQFLTRLRLGLSHLNEHRFKHNFQNCINPLSTCSLEVESTKHFFLHCHNYSALLPEDMFVKILLYRNRIFDKNDNQEILETFQKAIVEAFNRPFSCAFYTICLRYFAITLKNHIDLLLMFIHSHCFFSHLLSVLLIMSISKVLSLWVLYYFLFFYTVYML